MIVEFNDTEPAYIKSFIVKQRSCDKVRTHFMAGKLLMFAKLSRKSFVYELTETMCFPDETVSNIYKKYSIEKVEIFHILTDTDRTSLKFCFYLRPEL